jgi:Pyridine nucleotide-disulphide oxidoreductase
MLDWLIVGGGIHGTYISNFLIKAGNVSPEKLAVVDPHEAPLAVWKRCTQSTCMKYLRSPGAHNLDVGAGALFRYAKGSSGEFYSKYQRPSLQLFNSHCDHIVQESGLGALRFRSTAVALERSKDGYILQTNNGELESKRVILSIGSSDCLKIPDWAKDLKSCLAPISHIFSEEFAQRKERDWSSAVVVGGGISGVQLALDLAKQQPGRITLLHARKLQTYQFDADPCWLDNRCLGLLSKQADFAERRRIVDNARHWGSFPEDIRRQLELAIKNGSLSCKQASVCSAHGDADSVEMLLSDGSRIESDLVILATGFEHCVPGGEFLNSTIKNLDLPIAPCGFPQTDKYLRWSDGLFVSGALAELTTGPASRNIVGARLAAQRIIEAEHGARAKPKEHNYYYFRSRRTG